MTKDIVLEISSSTIAKIKINLRLITVCNKSYNTPILKLIYLLTVIDSVLRYA